MTHRAGPARQRRHGGIRHREGFVGQTPGNGGSEWIVFRVTDITVPPVDLASDDMKKMKDTLQKALTDEQLAEYVTKIETDIGTSINEAAFAQITGASN